MRALLLAAALGIASLAAAKGPTVGPAAPFAGGIAGPEGLAFTDHGTLIVGSTGGALLEYGPSGPPTLLADVDQRVAGVTVLRDGRVLAATFGTGEIWQVTPGGAATVLASGVGGANFIVETPTGRVLASASLDGTIVDVTSGTPIVRASGLTFPNGLAVGKDGSLYVAETLASRVSRMALAPDGTLGPPEPYASGLLLADGIGFDRAGNLFVVGGGTLAAVVARTGAVVTFPADPLITWASNLAFGRGRGFKRRDVYLANYGPALGDGTTVVRLRTNHAGLKLRRPR